MLAHKKEKQFVLSTYSKWSIIGINTINFTFPFLLCLDHFKNAYMAKISIMFKDLIFYELIILLAFYFNNLIIQYIYQAKFVQKLSDKMKSVGKI